jgi:hypothetical protein
MLVPAIASTLDAVLLEKADHADVRQAARAAAGKHQAHARAWWLRSIVGNRPGKGGRGCQPAVEQQRNDQPGHHTHCKVPPAGLIPCAHCRHVPVPWSTKKARHLVWLQCLRILPPPRIVPGCRRHDPPPEKRCRLLLAG